MPDLFSAVPRTSDVTSRRRLRLRAIWLSSLALGLIATDVSAQFSAKGRGPRPGPSAQPTQPKTPTVSKRTSDETARAETLIARYEKLIIAQPGEEVPLTRLAELVRQRDGNLARVLADLEARAEREGHPYTVLVAWGGMLAQDGQIAAAIAKLERAVERDGARAEAWLLLGRLQQSLDRHQDARRSFEKALPHVSGPEKSLLVRSLRDSSLDMGDLEGAKKYHRTLTEDARGNLFLQGELGRELLRRGKTQEAIAELTRVAKSASGDPRAEAPALRDLGQAQIEANQLDAAVKSLSRASKLSVASPGLRVAIDTLLADAHRKRGTLSQFLQELAASSQNSERLGLLGQLYEEEGQTDNAIDAYKKALSRDESDIDLRLRLVRLYEVTGELEEAASEYGKLVRAAPDDVQLSLRYMEMLLAQGHRDKTIREWDRIETRTRGDPEAGLMLLDMAERLEEKQRAERVLTRLSSTTNRDPRFLVELGARYYQAGDTKSAQRTWKKILTVHRDRAQAHVTYGEVLIDHEAAEDGVAELRKAVELAPNEPKIHQSLALGLERVAASARGASQAGYEREALQHFERVLELIRAQGQTESSEQLASLARRHIVRIYKRTGRLEQQLLPLEKRLNDSPPDLEAGRLLVEGYVSLRRDRAAIGALKKIVQHAPGDRQALLKLESAYLKVEDYPAAIKTLERLVEADPKRAQEYYERMARAAALRNDTAGALKFAELAVQRNPGDPTAQAQLGDLYLTSGRPKEAENAFRKALAQDDRLHLVSLRLAELLSKTGRAEEALDVLFHVMRTAREHEIVRRATRRALSLGVPLGQTRQVEDTLRPLAIGRPEQPLYRSLLLEVLSAQMYPLILQHTHGSLAERMSAEEKLEALSDRSTGPLLAALAGDHKGEQQTAITLLSHGGTHSAGLALLAFAEGPADLNQRLVAILALGQLRKVDFTDRLIELVMNDESVRRGQLAQAATWVLSIKGDSRRFPALIRALKDGDPEVRSYAALGLADAKNLPPRTSDEATRELLTILSTPTSGSVARAAAALALGKMSSDPGTAPTVRREVEEQLVAVTMNRSTLLSRAALVALSSGPPGAETSRAIARGLLDAEDEVRRAATTAAARLTLRGTDGSEGGAPALTWLPARIEPNEMSATMRVEAALDAAEAMSEAGRAKALVLLRDDLQRECRLALRASAETAITALRQLEPTDHGAGFGQLLSSEDLQKDENHDIDQAKKAAEQLRVSLLDEVGSLAEGPHPQIRVAALRVLQPTDGPQALRALRAGLRDESSTVHQAALDSISRTPSNEGVTALENYLQTETQWARRRRSAQALGQIMANASDSDVRQKSKALLVRLQGDPSPLVRKQAKQSLAIRKP